MRTLSLISVSHPAKLPVAIRRSAVVEAVVCPGNPRSRMRRVSGEGPAPDRGQIVSVLQAVGTIDPGPRPHAETRVVRVFIAGRIRLYREALADVLARDDGLEIVGASGEQTEILARVAAVEPDVVLLDPAAAETLELIRALAAPATRVKLVALVSSEAEPDVIAYAEAGVSGFVTCEESLADLVATIQRAARGELVVSPEAAGALLRRVIRLAAERPDAAEERLTPRELEVAFLLDEGLSNKQIAARLHLEVPTVKHHVHHILHKLGVANRSAAVARLRRRELLVTARRG